MGEDEAHVQLGTWLTALYSRSRQLLPGKAMTMLPSLAVLSILVFTCMHDNWRMDLIEELS